MTEKKRDENRRGLNCFRGPRLLKSEAVSGARPPVESPDKLFVLRLTLPSPSPFPSLFFPPLPSPLLPLSSLPLLKAFYFGNVRDLNSITHIDQLFALLMGNLNARRQTLGANIKKTDINDSTT
jgi:hypothetical protein